MRWSLPILRNFIENRPDLRITLQGLMNRDLVRKLETVVGFSLYFARQDIDPDKPGKRKRVAACARFAIMRKKSPVAPGDEDKAYGRTSLYAQSNPTLAFRFLKIGAVIYITPASQSIANFGS